MKYKGTYTQHSNPDLFLWKEVMDFGGVGGGGGGPEQWFYNLPPVSRIWLGMTLVITVTINLDILHISKGIKQTVKSGDNNYSHKQYINNPVKSVAWYKENPCLAYLNVPLSTSYPLSRTWFPSFNEVPKAKEGNHVRLSG